MIATPHGLFMAQALFSASGMFFSIGMLVIGKDPSIYLPVLTGIIGYWVPNPKINQPAQNTAQSHPPPPAPADSIVAISNAV